MNRAGRGLVGELGHRRRDAAPRRRAVAVAGGRQLMGARGAFLERPIAVTLEHELRRPPNVDPWVSRRKSCTAADEKGLS